MTSLRTATPAGVPRSELPAAPIAPPWRWWRRVPPAYSPLPAHALRQAAGDLLRRRDVRPTLSASLATLYDADAVRLLDSGTHALELSIRVAARIVGGTPAVALPAYACFDIATAAVATGLPLLLYDVQPRTLEPDLESLHAALRAGAGVVVVAPLYGMAVPWDGIHTMALRAGAIVVEDAAQGQGSRWRGRPAGQQALLSVLSFGRGKGWTGAGGGALLARGEAARALNDGAAHLSEGGAPSSVLLRALAMSVFVHPMVHAAAAALPGLHLGETRYRPPAVPHELSRVSASLLLASRDAANAEAERRQAAAAWYLERLADLPRVAPVAPVSGALGGYLRLPVRVAYGIAGFPPHVPARALGIAPGYPSPLGQLLPVHARLASPSSTHHWPGADTLARQLITLPTHSLADERDRRATVAALAAYPRGLPES